MLFFYILFTSLIYPLTLILPFVSKKAKVFLDKRKQDKIKMKNFNFDSQRKVIWLHAASVGELDQCKAIAKVIRNQEKETLILQSVFSESVQEKNFDLINTDITFRLPLDFYFSYDFIFKKFSPKKLVLMAWDTWPNLILAANRYGCDVYLACAVLDAKSKRTSYLVKNLTKQVFSKLTAISAVNESMIEPFRELSRGKTFVNALGDARFDSVVDKIKSKEPNSEFLEFAKQRKESILILASTYKECDSFVLSQIDKILDLGYSVWIFPHHINEARLAEVQSYLATKNLNVSLYSKVKNPCKDRIILFDVLGILAFAYFYGKIAYIGGAVHNKVHNVLEPAYFGLPLLSGEKILNSFDAVSLSKLGTLKIINSSEGFLEAVQFYSEKKNLEVASNLNKNYVLDRVGASLAFYNTFLKDELSPN